MRSRVKIPLKFTDIAKLLVLAIPVSVCSYNGVVENGDLRWLFTTNRKLPMATDIGSEFSDCQWYQWQPMAANGTNGKITNGTIGKTPNARNISRFGDSMYFQDLQKSHSTNRNISQTLQHFDSFNYDCS